MQEETIREPLGWVDVRFHAGRIDPLAFRWGSRTFEVRKVNAAWTDRETAPLRRFFSVTVRSGEVFQICYQEGDPVWTLDSLLLP